MEHTMETLDQAYFGPYHRVRLVPDYTTIGPDGDCYPPTVYTDLSWTRPEPYRLALNHREFRLMGFDDPEDVASIVSRIKYEAAGIHRDWQDIAKRYFRIFFDAELFIFSSGPTYALMFSTPHWREVTGVHEDTELIHDDCSNGFDYLEGRTYGLVHEKRIPACEHGHPESWKQVDTVWGFYGFVDIKEQAKEFFILP